MRAIAKDLAALVVGVGNDHRPVEKERLCLVVCDELEAFVREQIVRVMNRLRGITGAMLTHWHDDV